MVHISKVPARPADSENYSNFCIKLRLKSALETEKEISTMKKNSRQTLNVGEIVKIDKGAAAANQEARDLSEMEAKLKKLRQAA